jgi:hypothetical protein
VSLSVAGDRKTAYMSQIRPYYRFGDVAECRRLSPGLSSQLSSIPSGGDQMSRQGEEAAFLAPKLQATKRRGGLFRAELPPLVNDPDS